METVILKLKETIIYLSTCLNEERMHNQQLQKENAQRLEEAIQKLSLKHAEDISSCIFRNQNEKNEIELRNKTLLEKVKKDCQEAFLRLQAEHSLLKASFKNYRFEIRDEMNTVLMFKIKNFLESQKEHEAGIIKKNEKMMEEMFNKKLEHAKNQVCTRINYIMDENRSRLNEMELIYNSGRYSLRKKSKQEENKKFEPPRLREVDDLEILEEKVKSYTSYINVEDSLDDNLLNLAVQKANKATNTVEIFENKPQKTNSFNNKTNYKQIEHHNLKTNESFRHFAPSNKRSYNKDIRDVQMTKLQEEAKHNKDEIKALQLALADMTTRHESCEEIAKTEFQSRVVAEDKLTKYKNHYKKLDKAYNSLLSTFVISEVDKKNHRKKHGVKNQSSLFSLNNQRTCRNQFQSNEKFKIHVSNSDISVTPRIRNFELDLEPYDRRKPRLPAVAERSSSPDSPSPRAPAHSLKSQPTSPVHGKPVNVSEQNTDLEKYDRRKVYNPKSLPVIGRFKPNLHTNFSSDQLARTTKSGPKFKKSGSTNFHYVPFGKRHIARISEGGFTGGTSALSLPIATKRRMVPLPEVAPSRLESSSVSNTTTYHNFNSNIDIWKKN